MEQTNQKEFRHYGFRELCQEIGEQAARGKAQMYEQDSKRYKESCPNWPVHNCWLLRTYRDPALEKPSIMEREVSVFYAPITNTTKQKRLPLHQVARLIQSNTFEPETLKLRTYTDKKENSRYKRLAFCYATFSGTFTVREDEKLVEHSGLICIDLDHLDDRLEEIRSKVIADPATVMCFISPNGDGLKVLYEMEPGKFSQEQYYMAYTNYLNNLLQLEPGKIDSSCKNVSRACFLPCDPSLFVNPYLIKDEL